LNLLNLITISIVCLTKNKFVHVKTAAVMLLRASVRTAAAINLQFNFKLSNKLNAKTIFRFNN